MNENIKEINEIVDKVMASEDIQIEIMYRKLDENLDFLKRQKAYEDGVEAGMKKAKKQQQREVAKIMKEENVAIDVIAKCTGLTKKVIEKL
jgi:predicted transposase/invertase (TIGR01784 family)